MLSMLNALNVLETFDPLQFYLISVRSVYGYFTPSTGGPSSSFGMIILRNSSHGEIIRVCMAIFMTDVRNKKYNQILNTNTSPYFHSASLVIWPLTKLKRTHFRELSISRFTT